LTYPGSGDTSPVGNNDFNVVVGIWDTGPNSTTGSGFVEWMGQFTSFQAGFPDVAVTQADGINDLGLIVGQEYTSYEYDNNQGHGFLAVGPFFTQLNYPGAMETTGWAPTGLARWWAVGMTGILVPMVGWYAPARKHVRSSRFWSRDSSPQRQMQERLGGKSQCPHVCKGCQSNKEPERNT